MNIKGFIKNSFLDWDGKIASIIFTGGCNFLCPFCHNADLIKDHENMQNVELDKIFDYLLQNKKWIDGIVISGGEPTIQKDIISFMENIKRLGFFIKLDTNGYNPKIIAEIFEKKLANYIAMDIKTSLIDGKYKKVIGLENENFNIIRILESIDLIKSEKKNDKNKNFDFEFRTTICPNFVDLDDLLNIAEKIENAKWYWQNFRKLGDLLDPQLKFVNSYSILKLYEFENIVKTNFPEALIKTRY